MKYWEIIADNLSKAGWSWGWGSAVDRNGRRIWMFSIRSQMLYPVELRVSEDNVVIVLKACLKPQINPNPNWQRVRESNPCTSLERAVS